MLKKNLKERGNRESIWRGKKERNLLNMILSDQKVEGFGMKWI